MEMNLIKGNQEMDTVIEGCPIIIRLCEGMRSAGVEDKDFRKHIKRITGISKQNMIHWFNGTTKIPNPHYLADLSEHFNIDLNWLITGKTINIREEIAKYDGLDVPVNTDEQDCSSIENSDYVCIDRLCEGIQNSGIDDVKTSLIETAKEIFDISSQTVMKWLNKESEPTLIQLANLCEQYGVAQRYVSLGLGPILALDYVTAVTNRNNPNHNEVLNLRDVALLGNA